MTDDELLDFMRRGLAAQRAVDEVLKPGQQYDERMPDGTYRVRCMSCGRSVSNPLPVPVIVRAHVTCADCIGRLTDP